MSISALPPRAASVLNENGQFTVPWYGWLKFVQALFAGGFTGTIITAKLTTGGATGSMTFVNGVLTKETAAT